MDSEAAPLCIQAQILKIFCRIIASLEQNLNPVPGSCRMISDLTQLFGTMAIRLISDVIRDSKLELPSFGTETRFQMWVLGLALLLG
jgi:hypothetical protein